MFRIAARSQPIHIGRMKKFAFALSGLLWVTACSPPDEHSPSPLVIPERNQTKSLENNASAPPSPEGNRTSTPTPEPAAELADFLPGKEIKLRPPNDSLKLSPRFEANGTWANILDPTQHGPYSVTGSGRVILSIADKIRYELLIKGESIKINDPVDVVDDGAVIRCTVEAIKED